MYTGTPWPVKCHPAVISRLHRPAAAEAPAAPVFKILQIKANFQKNAELVEDFMLLLIKSPAQL